MSHLRLGIVQMACTASKEENLARAIRGIRDCAKQGAQLVCLQELVNTLYFCQSEDVNQFSLSESIPGPTTDTIAEVAHECGVVVVVPIFERRAAGIYHNSAAVIERDGTLAGVYRKMHIPDDPGYYEKFYFVPGDLGFQAIPTSVGKLGVLICWDQWFPEGARLTALQGADLLIYPTAIGWKDGQDEVAAGYHEMWKTSMRGHAVANGMHVVAVNRVGHEAEMKFWGGSFVADPTGTVIYEAGESAVNTVVDLNLGLTERQRQEWPFLRDRRIDAYGGLLKVFGK